MTGTKTIDDPRSETISMNVTFLSPIVVSKGGADHDGRPSLGQEKKIIIFVKNMRTYLRFKLHRIIFCTYGYFTKLPWLINNSIKMMISFKL